MFIALLEYKNDFVRVEDRFLVFDTDDMSLEYITLSDYADSGVTILGVVMSDSGVSYISRSSFSTCLMTNLTDNIRVISDISNTTITAKGYPQISLGKTIENFPQINGKSVLPYGYAVSTWDIAYMFKFRDYTVVRLWMVIKGKLFPLDYIYFTVVLNNNGDIILSYDQWYKRVFGDILLAIKIDTICEY